MSSRSSSAPARRGRPRSAHARRAVLDAVRELVEEGGYSAATIEAIAARSGVATVLRVAWVFFVPTQPTSDSAVYHGLAARLAQTGVYDTAKHRAYWPPGYPEFVCVMFRV